MDSKTESTKDCFVRPDLQNASQAANLHLNEKVWTFFNYIIDIKYIYLSPLANIFV